LENRKKDLFKKTFEGKTIAVVGNGPSELGKNKGAEIDGHDIVVRFNNYQTTGFEEDYGSKTDVWVRGGALDGGDQKEKYALIVLAEDYDYQMITNVVLGGIHNKWLADDICEIRFDTREAWRNTSGLLNPTTGAIFMWKLYEEFGSFDHIDFYGFNFCQDQFGTYSTHYYKDRDKKGDKRMSSRHNLYQESEFLSYLVSKKSKNDVLEN
jgi:hypothetical protein